MAYSRGSPTRASQPSFSLRDSEQNGYTARLLGHAWSFISSHHRSLSQSPILVCRKRPSIQIQLFVFILLPQQASFARTQAKIMPAHAAAVLVKGLFPEILCSLYLAQTRKWVVNAFSLYYDTSIETVHAGWQLRLA